MVVFGEGDGEDEVAGLIHGEGKMLAMVHATYALQMLLLVVLASWLVSLHFVDAAPEPNPEALAMPDPNPMPFPDPM